MLDKSINLARRLSMKNETELFQSAIEDEEDHDEIDYTKDFCEAIARKIHNESDLPIQCKAYSSVMEAIHNTTRVDHEHAIALVGMNSGAALAAKAARERGHLNPSQIQRRYTHRNRKSRVW